MPFVIPLTLSDTGVVVVTGAVTEVATPQLSAVPAKNVSESLSRFTV